MYMYTILLLTLKLSTHVYMTMLTNWVNEHHLYYHFTE